MPVDVLMPELSSDMTEADLVSWLVKPGDTVQRGDLICELETEKSTVEFESPVDGTLLEIVVPEGTNGVEVGTVIAIFQADARADAKADAGADAKADARADARADSPAAALPSTRATTRTRSTRSSGCARSTLLARSPSMRAGCCQYQSPCPV